MRDATQQVRSARAHPHAAHPRKTVRLPPGLTVLIVAALSIVAVHAPAALAQAGGSYVLRSTLDGGGGTAASGGYRVDATIGQPAVGAVSGGNALVVLGGFWGSIGAVATSTPTATVTATLPSTPTATLPASPTQTATVVLTAPASTLTPSVTAIAATRTPSSPTASRSPSATATPSPTATPPACVGDCDQRGTVTVDELVKGVNIALGTTSVDVCPSFDTNGDGVVTINELIAAVNRALSGCAAAEG